MIASILVALDNTAIAPHVLARAVEIAERFDAKLFLFRAVLVDPEFPAAAGHASGPDPLPAALCKAAMKELEALVAAHAGAKSAEGAKIVVEIGDGWRAIVATADRLGVDLVVMGSHLYHWYDSVLGTTTRGVAQHAHRDVLIVHQPLATVPGTRAA